MLEVIMGHNGLFYATDREILGLLVASDNANTLMELVADAKRLLEGEDLELVNHSLYRDGEGICITIPTPEWQTLEQREETVRQVQRVFLNMTVARGNA